ncbi:MAG: DUF473 domain-containing protein [Halobacteriota archaeon]|nr:DUF473 domain-containing protein [Halobacteriota archaeon]
MSYTTLTGIMDSVLRDLKNQRLKTIELRSANNLISAMNIGVGDMVFLTKESSQDLTCGTTGMIAKVNGLQTTMHRVFQGNEYFYEERETMVTRIQLQAHGFGRIRSVKDISIGKPTVVEAEELRYYEAR